ncbi:MAG: lipoyl(octanoyl) transferase [Zetaproteobacteria bacterium]|nr:MAG: lipoyl(octanoyl) transferase [Zetaproteobacteria bacterium]
MLADMEWAWLGRKNYVPMWRLLQQRAREVASGVCSEVVWFCEHEPVYTTGRRGVDNRLRRLHAPFVQTDRGGETTFHGPGQLLLYPVVDLRSRGLGVKTYVYMLEQSCIALLAGFGIDACRRCGMPGVWTTRGKMAALGIRVSQGVAYHGLALNVHVERAWFEAIDPCGLGEGIDRMEDWGVRPGMGELSALWMEQFYRLLQRAG